MSVDLEKEDDDTDETYVSINNLCIEIIKIGLFILGLIVCVLYPVFILLMIVGITLLSFIIFIINNVFHLFMENWI